MKKIAVLGAGLMGSKIAGCYDRYGYEVSLYSRTEKTLARAKETIAQSHITFTTNVEEAVKDAFYVVETVSEQRDIKEALYLRLDELLPPDVIISSNTSYLNIFEFMPKRRQKKTCIVHWFTPADILPLVEIVKGPETDEPTMQAMLDLHRACGKAPVRMEKYIPGFIINRLQTAMNWEVLHLLSNGYCSAEDLDLAVKTSLMPRGLLLGVVQRMDFNGLDTVAHCMESGSYVPAGKPGPDNIVAALNSIGDIGIKSGKGFYDYTDMTFREVVKSRDEQLQRSVDLAAEFIAHPIGKKK